MGLFDNLKNKSKGLEKDTSIDEDRSTSTISMKPYIVMINDGVNICALACSSCWDTKLPDDYQARANYIGRRTRTGHTSIIEHSNVVFYLFVPKNREEDLLELLDMKNFLHSCVKKSEKYDGYHLIIGGSWRAFSDIYLNCYSLTDNKVLNTITKAIFEYIPSDGMRDLIDMGIFDESSFSNIDLFSIASSFSLESNSRIDDDINIVNCDDIYQLASCITQYCPEPWLFNTKDLLKFATVTIEFNHMSRIITQQLTRHRNGITQESQRYVDYSGAPFNSPAKFKPDKYNPKRLYEFRFGGTTYKMNLQAIGDNINAIYPQLRDKMKYGNEALLPEDARAYLSNNTQCGRIFITFTYYNLIKFLQLREDSHAQAEIKSYGDRIGNWFRLRVMSGGMVDNKADLYSALVANIKGIEDSKNIFFKPLMEKVEDSSYSIDRSTNEVTEDISEEEYTKLYEQSIKAQDEIDGASKED